MNNIIYVVSVSFIIVIWDLILLFVFRHTVLSYIAQNRVSKRQVLPTIQHLHHRINSKKAS